MPKVQVGNAILATLLLCVTVVRGATLDLADRYRREQRSARRERSVKPDKAEIARLAGAFAEIRFSVRDTGGIPIGGAEIEAEAACPANGKPIYIKAVTDTNGYAVASGIWKGHVIYYVRRDGFYKAHGDFAFEKLSDDGQRWTWDAVTEVRLRREVAPHPMLKRTVRMEDLPSRNCRVGYDILKGDFTPPAGRGEVADVKILFYHADVQRFPTDGGSRSMRLAIVPGKETRGFSVARPVRDALGGPAFAPAKYGGGPFSFSATDTRRGWHMPPKTEETQEIEGNFYLFEARGRSGMLTFDNFGLPYFPYAGPGSYGFAMQFRMNERPGETNLVATGGRRYRDDGKRPAVAEESDVPPAAGSPEVEGDLLLAATGPHSAVFFGTKSGGGFIPAAFADRKLGSLEGVKFLKVDESVGVIPDGAFEGSKDLVSVELRQSGPMDVGSRAFASCPNLGLVYSRDLREFEIRDDSFDGAAPGLSCILHGTSESTRTGIHPWARLITLLAYGGGFPFFHHGSPCFMEGDFLCRADEYGTASVEKYLGGPTDILFLPETAAGITLAGLGSLLFPDGLKARVVVVPERIAERCEGLDFHATQGPDILVTHGWPVLRRRGGKRPKEYVIAPVRGSGYGADDAIVLPPDTDPRDIAAGALVETNGFTALRRGGGAVLIHFSGGNADRIEVPAEIGGVPVVELGDHLFAGCGAREFVLPPTLRKIGFCSFAGLGECRALAVPEGVEEIDAGAFFDCARLKSLSLPSSLRKIGYGAFEAMPAAPDIPKGAQVDAPRAFSSAR